MGRLVHTARRVKGDREAGVDGRRAVRNGGDLEADMDGGRHAV